MLVCAAQSQGNAFRAACPRWSSQEPWNSGGLACLMHIKLITNILVNMDI